MKRNAAVLIAALSLAAVPAFAQHQSHESHHAPSHNGHAAQPAKLSLAQGGSKWATDEPLRRHMADIRAMLAQKSDLILAGKLTEEQAKAIGAAIELKVAAIVADCKLSPEADAQLHVIVAELVEAADILQGKTRLKPDRGTSKAVRATQMYATYFQHPGWQPVHY